MPDFSQFPEVFVSNASIGAAVSRATKLGKLRKLGSRLYTRNFEEPAERLVLRHLWMIVDAYLPGALVADRTAMENRPAEDGSVFLVADHKRDILLPGVKLRPRKGPAALETDLRFAGSLRISSTARAFLENMRRSRARNGVARTLGRGEVEERLEGILRSGGEARLLQLRDEARLVAQALGMAEEFEALTQTIGGLLGTRKAKLVSSTAIARSLGKPYDGARVALFQELFAELRGMAPVIRPERKSDGNALPFFEAYFSNFIEGTEFAVDEAEDLVFSGVIPKGRPQDAHDVLGTWAVVSDLGEMKRRPENAEALIELLRERHARVMAGRPEQGPGLFKLEPNRAGSTLFVAPELVAGTLVKGYEIYRGLELPLSRAIFMMFLVAEVHPFGDGNGRVARIMMNAELVAEGECRIVVPTIYRNNYLAALKALSQNRSAKSLVRALDFAQRYTAAIDFSDLNVARLMLERTHAFVDPNEADVEGIRLTMPEPGLLA